MGSKFNFTCTNCNYSAMVSGERDYGMEAVVQTMVCADCQELVDVSIGRFGEDGPTGDADYDKDLGRCPECDGGRVSVWLDAHLCPRCRGEMTREEDLIVLWD